MRSIAAAFALGSLGAMFVPPPDAHDEKDPARTAMTVRIDEAPRIARRDTVTGAGRPDRRFVIAVRDLLESRFDVDALPWDTPITYWHVDEELIAFSLYRPDDLGGEVHAARTVVEGDIVRWILHDGTSLDGPMLSRPVRYTAISSKIGLREHPIRRKIKFHAGTDYAAPIGTPIRSIANGVVVKKGRNWVSGKWLAIRHDDGHVSKYLHLDAWEPGIEEGVRVYQGELIGTVGKTGRVTGPHLHFELRDRWGYPIDMTVARWPGSRIIEDAHVRRAFEQRFALLRTYREDGTRSWFDPLLLPRAAFEVPPSSSSLPSILPPIAPVRASGARARLTPPPRVRRKRLSTMVPTFDVDGPELDDPLVRRAIALALEFPDDPVVTRRP